MQHNPQARKPTINHWKKEFAMCLLFSESFLD